MKILISLSYFRPYISGLSRYAENLSRILADEGHEVDIICCRHEPEATEREKIPGGTIFRFAPTWSLGKIRFCSRMAVWAVKQLKNYDRLIINLPQPEGILLAAAAKLAGIKTVAIFHCQMDPAGVPGGKAGAAIVAGFNQAAMRLADRIVVNSKDYADNIGYLRRLGPKVTGSFPPIISGGKVSRPKRIRPNRLAVGYLGRIAREKNLETLIEAVAGMKEVRLKIAGPEYTAGNEDYRADILKRAKRAGNRVELTGELDDREIAGFLAGIDILALPSDSLMESFGMVQAEAMLAGRPVITTDLPGVREPVIQTGAGQLVKQPREVREWRKAIAEIGLNYQRYAAAAVAGGKEFSVRKTAARWKRILSF